MYKKKYFFILSGFKYYVLAFKNKYIVLMLYYESLLLLLRCDTGKVRDMGRFKGGFKCKGWVSCVNTDVIACW